MSYLRVIDPAEPCGAFPPAEGLSMAVPYALDPFQQHAVAAIHAGRNVLVTAKTGSGKTFVGEYQIAHSLAKGGRVFYTTPIKSLSNQKFHDLKEAYPGKVGIMTGDVKFCPDAPIVIMTTEILRNLLYKQGSITQSLGITAGLSLEGLDAVIFDECHYINDRDRGAVWEETLILLPPAVHLILLSATIDKPEFFAEWLGSLKKIPIDLISTQYRVVPLQHGVFRVSGDTYEFLEVMNRKDQFDPGLYKAWLLSRTAAAKAADDHRARVTDRRRGGYEDPSIGRSAPSPKAFRHQLNELVARLETKGLLPALVFVFSRKGCEEYAKAVEHTLIDSSDTAAVRHIVSFHLHRYMKVEGGLEKNPEYHAILSLLEKGIAYHHSGMLPILKEIVEILFGKGLIKLLFATETFAVGINMPTKTVVFTGYRKYDDVTRSHRMLNTDEYIQMAGRAGRRGKDDKGLVLYLPDREPESVEDVKRMMTGARQTFQSRMNFHYDFLLKTIQLGQGHWIDLMKQSYWYRRHAVALEKMRAELAALEAEGPILTEEEVLDMLRHDELRAHLKDTVNAARKKAQAAWDAWDRTHMGNRWTAVRKELWTKHQERERDLRGLKVEISVAETPETGVEPSLAALKSWGYLDESGALTALGLAATEVNEGQQILMTQLYEQKSLWSSMTAAELLSTLCCFLEEDKEQVTIEGLGAPAAVKDAIRFVAAEGRQKESAEAALGAPYPPKESYWTVSVGWVDPIYSWLSDPDCTIFQLCETYGFYSGNFVRMVMKVGNLLEEWRSLATLDKNVECLEKLRGIEATLFRGITMGESLYLKI